MSKQSYKKHFERNQASRFQGFQSLMRYRIRNILLVSSLYDLFVFEEDGRLYELIRKEYQGLNLSHSPEITRVSSGKEAFDALRHKGDYDLIITTQHIEDMGAVKLAEIVKKQYENMPVVLLGYDNRELMDLMQHEDTSIFDRMFIWNGDFKIIIAIVKHLEDLVNIENDTKNIGVQIIILIEDEIRFYSLHLPLLYTEILNQSQRLISEGINLSHKYLRMRARPKIILCNDYESAWNYFIKYEEYILGIISDINFKRKGIFDDSAGLHFAQKVKKRHKDISILLQSADPTKKEAAEKIGSHFLLKQSPTFLQELRQFALDNFGFGDFIFRDSSGKEITRANDLLSMEEIIKDIPEDSIRYHAERNHFSNWLKARTEFQLAHELRPRKVTDYDSIEDLRTHLVNSLRAYRKSRRKGIIVDFNEDIFDFEGGLSRIGGGSIGGKARGLSFVSALINKYELGSRFDNVNIHVPPGIIIGTDVFDLFLEQNDLKSFALQCEDDQQIQEKFQQANFPEKYLSALMTFTNSISEPIAVRSSSLLEDSQYHPFAGIYRTYMLPNNDPDPLNRLGDIIKAIKNVYASIYFKSTKNYVRITAYRLEEEKMAILIQKIIGDSHNEYFYPDFSGVAKSYNYYPVAPQKASDGIVSMALGLGKFVVDGGNSVKFCPKYPNLVPQFYSIDQAIKNRQTDFYAIKLNTETKKADFDQDPHIELLPVEHSESDGVLNNIGSTYSHENNTIYDGISRSGMRIVSFAPILKYNLFPINKILSLLLEIGRWGMGTPVEIEFAVNISKDQKKHEFGILQIRPLVLKREHEVLDLKYADENDVLCLSNNALGHGIIENIKHIVYIDPAKLPRAETRRAANEINQINKQLLDQDINYLLIGPGRWGSLDPWLGIPVKWEHICAAKTIVETEFKDIQVEPSQGSHFFHNLTSFLVGYFTLNQNKNSSFIDWGWLRSQQKSSLDFVNHIVLEEPITIKINGKINKGVIFKP